MSINDQNRQRKTYSFFRAPPIAAASTLLSGGLGIIVTGNKNAVVISFDSSAISGTLYFAGAGMTLRNNNTFDLNLGAGTGISFTTGSGNSLTINSSGGGSSNGWIDGGGKMKTTGSISIDASSNYASAIGTDVFLYVSGTISSGSFVGNPNRKVSVFGGDIVFSGSMLSFATTSVGPTITQAEAVADVPVQNIFLIPQPPFKAASVNFNPGDVIIKIPSGTNEGSAKYGGLQVTYGTNAYGTRIGSIAGNGSTNAVWFFDGGAPGQTNYALLGSSTDTHLNSPNGSVFVEVGANPVATFTATTANVSVTGQIVLSSSLNRVSGAASFHNGLSGSLTRLDTGASYLVAGTNVSIVSASNGQVFISSTGGGGSSGWVDGGGKMKTTGSISVDASNRYADAIGTDVFFFVSGSSNSSAGSSNRHVALFSDVVSSGTFQAGAGLNYAATIGPDSVNPTLEAGIWLLPPGTAPSGVNMSLLYNGSATYMNTPGSFLSFTTFGFGINMAWMQGSLSQFYLWSMPNFTWDPSGGAPTLWHVGRLVNALPQNFTVHAQDAYSGAAVANQNGGNVVLMGGAPASSTGSAGQIVHSGSTTTFVGPDGVQRAALSASSHGQLFVGGNGSDFLTMMGPMPSFEGADAGYWALPPGTTPTSANALFYADSSNCIVNAPGGAGSIYFYQHGGTEMAVMAPSLFSLFMPTIQWDKAEPSPTLSQAALTSDVAAQTLHIEAQPPFPGATVNRNPGVIALDVPSPSSAGGAANAFYGGVVINAVSASSVPLIRMGYYGGPDITYGGIWFIDGGSQNGTNFAFLGNQTQTYLNQPSSGGTINLSFQGTAGQGVNISLNTFTFRTTNQVKFGALLTGSIGQEAQTFGAGANLTIQAQQGSGSNVGGDLVLSGGLGSGQWLSPPGKVAILGAVRYTNRTLTGSVVIDSLGADFTLFLSGTTTGPAQTNVLLTLPPPVQGRRLTFKDTVGILNANGSGAGIVSWQITGSNAAKFIEALTSSYALNAPFQRVTLESDGTSWWVTG